MNNAIHRFLDLLDHKNSGGIIEVVTFHGNRPQLAGYFNDVDRAASEIERFNGRENVYVSLNPVNRDLLARANNRLIQCKNRITDSDVLCDSWLFIDIDPDRPSGISSTEAELDLALEVQQRVYNWLLESGVPEQSLITAISGNGAYILARVTDYPITPELVKVKKRLLKLIADKFSTERVKIDEKVYNPSRLMCALGTLKVKGDPTEDRPHRPSHIWRVAGVTFDPKEAQEVTPFDLYTLAEGWLEQEPVAEVKATLPTHKGAFDIRDLAPSLPGYLETDRGWAYAKCPAHNGNGDTSLQVYLATGAYRCADGCTTDRIREALGVSAPARRLVEGEEETRRPSVSWPASPTSDALQGLAGDIVKTISPHSEADSAALLLQFLVAFGNAIGRSAHFRAEADEHYLNLFIALVGPSSKGRKGTSWSQIRRLFGAVDEEWINRVQTGLSSGEGLIWAVRDAISKREAVKEKGRVVDYQEVVVDDGIEDKRLLALESEFASALRAIGREGNTLSAIVRQAWDTGALRVLTKNSPAQASGAHISIIAHITSGELKRYLDSTEVGNGFANRFLWPCVRRSKSLPEGGRLHEIDFAPIIRRLRGAIEFARTVGEMKRDEEARALWFRAYNELSEGKPGLMGAVTSRGEAQVMRLACIYALLDLSSKVCLPHLKAALAVWRYCEESARFIFGDSLGDPLADEILRALQGSESGMTRTDISNLFGRNKRANEIGRALNTLLEAGLLNCVREAVEGPGRPTERWVAARVSFSQPLPSYEINEVKEVKGDDSPINALRSVLSSTHSGEIRSTSEPQGALWEQV